MRHIIELSEKPFHMSFLNTKEDNSTINSFQPIETYRVDEDGNSIPVISSMKRDSELKSDSDRGGAILDTSSRIFHINEELVKRIGRGVSSNQRSKKSRISTPDTTEELSLIPHARVLVSPLYKK